MEGSKNLMPLKQRGFADFPNNIGLSLTPAAFTKNAHVTLSLDCLPPLHYFAVIPFFALLVVTFLIEILMPFLFVELMLLIRLLPRFFLRGNFNTSLDRFGYLRGSCPFDTTRESSTFLSVLFRDCY